jgi:hypothetical protein
VDKCPVSGTGEFGMEMGNTGCWVIAGTWDPPLTVGVRVGCVHMGVSRRRE